MASPAPVITESPHFWMVWTKAGHKPRVIHHTEALALAEAERLARLHPGSKFIVLRATHKLHVAPVTVEAEAA